MAYYLKLSAFQRQVSEFGIFKTLLQRISKCKDSKESIIFKKAKINLISIIIIQFYT